MVHWPLESALQVAVAVERRLALSASAPRAVACVPCAIGSRGDTPEVLEEAPEMWRIEKTQGIGDVGDGMARVQQEPAGMLDASSLEVGHGAQARGLAEQPREIACG